MSKEGYTQTIYPDVENDYPMKLCKHISERFFYETAHLERKPRLLDVGCGKGTHLDCFSTIGFDAIGIDSRECRGPLNFKICNIEEWLFPFPDKHFDFVFSKSVIEHVKNPDNMMKEIMRVLKPCGVVVIMTPDWNSQHEHFWDDYTHCHPYTRKSLKDMLAIFGFQDVVCELFYQLPFVWGHSVLEVIPKIVSAISPQSWKWKDSNERNGSDRKLIRFSKEKMLLSAARKAWK